MSVTFDGTTDWITCPLLYTGRPFTLYAWIPKPVHWLAAKMSEPTTPWPGMSDQDLMAFIRAIDNNTCSTMVGAPRYDDEVTPEQHAAIAELVGDLSGFDFVTTSGLAWGDDPAPSPNEINSFLAKGWEEVVAGIFPTPVCEHRLFPKLFGGTVCRDCGQQWDDPCTTYQPSEHEIEAGKKVGRAISRL